MSRGVIPLRQLLIISPTNSGGSGWIQWVPRRRGGLAGTRSVAGLTPTTGQARKMVPSRWGSRKHLQQITAFCSLDYSAWWLIMRMKRKHTLYWLLLLRHVELRRIGPTTDSTLSWTYILPSPQRHSHCLEQLQSQYRNWQNWLWVMSWPSRI